MVPDSAVQLPCVSRSHYYRKSLRQQRGDRQGCLPERAGRRSKRQAGVRLYIRLCRRGRIHHRFSILRPQPNCGERRNPGGKQAVPQRPGHQRARRSTAFRRTPQAFFLPRRTRRGLSENLFFSAGRKDQSVKNHRPQAVYPVGAKRSEEPL